MDISSLLSYSDYGLFVLRLSVGVIFIYHSLPKLMKPGMMAQMIGWNSGAVLFLGLVEMLGSIGLILGFYAQQSALSLGIVMVGAIYMKTMKWSVPFSAHDKTGWEFDMILLAANIVILTGGAGSIGI